MSSDIVFRRPYSEAAYEPYNAMAVSGGPRCLRLRPLDCRGYAAGNYVAKTSLC